MAIPFSAFLPLIGQGVNALSNLFTNKAQKDTNLEMYNRQRMDALSDWNMQNQYNSPSSQMQRFKEAGLSPHLIYGQTNTAPPVRSADAKPPSYVAPQLDSQASNPILMALQLDNMKKQGALLDSQVVKNNSETNWKNLNTEFLNQTMPYRAEQLFQQSQLTGKKVATEQEKTIVERNKQQLQKQQVQNIIANTNLTTEKKAQVTQMILNMKQAEQLLGEKVKSEQYLNSVQQQLQSFGIVGNTLASILRLFK
ncbi:MAG: DNA pilot protein [Microviridae sp.]|nr:MAG: DNA pilot protein [Microviridae sp.]